MQSPYTASFGLCILSLIPNLNKKFKTKLQTLQNKYVRFCIQLDSGAHVEIEFKKINCPPVDYIFGQYLTPNSLDIPYT